MFCPKCGTKNLDDARFCCKCGNSLPVEPHSPPLSQAETASSITSAERSVSTTAQKKSKVWLVGVGVLFVAIIAAVAVFFIRTSGESSLLANVASTISDSSKEDVEAYYDQFLPVSYTDGGYTQGCHYDKFRLEKGNDGNTFLVTGLLTVTDLSIEERPSYQIGISGTVKTNFFRSEYTVEWSYDFEEPEIRLPSVDLSWVEGTYHQAHYYPMVMEISIYEDNSNSIYYTIFNGDDFLGEGVAYYVGGEDKPRFEGEIYGSTISIEYDGYDFIVNCSSLEFEDISFFED